MLKFSGEKMEKEKIVIALGERAMIASLRNAGEAFFNDKGTVIK